MNKAPNGEWFTVKVKFDREYGTMQISKPNVKEVEIIDGTFFLRDKHGKNMEEAPLDEIKWYKVKPQRRDIAEEVLNE